MKTKAENIWESYVLQQRLPLWHRDVYNTFTKTRDEPKDELGVKIKEKYNFSKFFSSSKCVLTFHALTDVLSVHT